MILSMQCCFSKIFGNFKKVRPDFLRVFRQNTHNSMGSQLIGVGKLKDKIGQNSPFSTAEVKTGADVIRELENNDVIGFVLATSDSIKDQVFSAFIETRLKNYSDNKIEDEKIIFAVDTNFIKDTIPDVYEKMNKNGDIKPSNNGVCSLYNEPMKFGKAKGFITTTVKAIKAAAPSVIITIIKKDETRKNLSYERGKAKKDIILTPKEYKQLAAKDLRTYAENFKYALRKRLDSYKSSKAVNASTPEEFIQHILKEGYIDKIKFNGLTYNRSRSNINLDKLMAKSTDSYYESSIEYEFADRFGTKDDDIEYTKFINMRKEAYEKSGYAAVKARIEAGEDVSEEEKEKYLDEYQKLCPPRTIKIKLKLDKTSIIPDEIICVR